MNTINILNGVTLASQEEVTGHTGNTTMHLTEEVRPGIPPPLFLTHPALTPATTRTQAWKHSTGLSF